MTWKRRTLAVLCFAVMALGFYANGGVYVTPQNIIVLLAFFGPLTILGLYCRLGLKMPLALFFRFVPLPFGLLLSAFFISVGLRYEHPFVLGGLIAALAGGAWRRWALTLGSKRCACLQGQGRYPWWWYSGLRCSCHWESFCGLWRARR